MTAMHLVCYHCYGDEFQQAQENDWRCTNCGSSHAIMVTAERLAELRRDVDLSTWEGEGGR